MVVEERERHHMNDRLDETIGQRAATALMKHLPPTGWGDVVTREYLDLRLDAQMAQIDGRFAPVDERFERVDQRFEQVDQRFDKIDQRFDKIDQRFDRIDGRFQKVDDRFGAVEHGLRERIDTVEQQVGERIEHEMRRAAVDIVNQISAAYRSELNEAIVGQGRLLVVSLFATIVTLGGFMLGLARFAG